VSKPSPRYLVSQVALVVGDLEAVVRDYHDRLGWGPWNIYEYRSPWLRDLVVRGEPAEFTWLGAEAQVGPVWMEVLQPLEGASPFSEWHGQHGDGVHHVGYEVDSMDEARAVHDLLGEGGAGELMSAWCGGIHFFYMDTRPLITEVWVGSAAALEPLRTYPES
jgi:catechol 2,3-dioxygenase-like lactoylglutathione lyase family enzyme